MHKADLCVIYPANVGSSGVSTRVPLHLDPGSYDCQGFFVMLYVVEAAVPQTMEAEWLCSFLP
jgi:hypothetical protein